MKLRILSDIHLERVSYSYGTEFMEWILPSLDTDKDTVLILAGDIFSLDEQKSEFMLMDYIHNRFKAVIYVFGNHEHYNSDLWDDSIQFKQLMRQQAHRFNNFYHLQNESIKIDDVLFVGGTLWTDFNKNNPNTKHAVQFGLNDYNYIKYNRNRLTADIIYNENYNTYQYLAKRNDKTLTKYTPFLDPSKTVIVTHHMPSLQCINPKYRSSGDINYGFASDLDDMIINLNPALWISGHTHCSYDFMINNTRLIANPLGYSNFLNKNYENKQFNNKLVLELY